MRPVDRVIERFGGISALANALGHKHPTTVSQWKVRGVIPARQQDAVLRAAVEKGIPLTPADFFDTDASPEPAPDKGEAAA